MGGRSLDEDQEEHRDDTELAEGMRNLDSRRRRPKCLDPASRG